MIRNSQLTKAALALLASAGAASLSWGASHSDAPLIKHDAQANLTDVYAFVGEKYNDPSTKVLNVLVSVQPFIDPGDGVIYERFSDDALYSIHIANPTTGETLQRYNFQFSDINPLAAPGLKNPNTILSYGLGTEVGPIMDIGDARQNFTQTYWVSGVGVEGGTAPAPGDTDVLSGADDTGNVLGADFMVAPPNVGGNVTPAYNDADGNAVSGASNFGELDAYTQQAIYELDSGIVVFAGSREDGFYADTPGIFDLLNARIVDNNGDLTDGLGQDGGGIDGFKGFNVLSYCVQIPVDHLPEFPFMDPFFGETIGVGVYASVSRRSITIRNADGDISVGKNVQVNRMGNPLFNEVLVGLADKDRYNRTSPEMDATDYAKYAENPEIATLLNVVFGTETVTTGRVDLRAVFIPDVLRVNTQTGPVTLPGQDGYSRVGFVGMDLTDEVNSAWPNGRRIGDDVVDIALTAVASGPSYETITVVGDNVAENDQEYNLTFPYLGTPHAGTTTNQRQAPEAAVASTEE